MIKNETDRKKKGASVKGMQVKEKKFFRE